MTSNFTFPKTSLTVKRMGYGAMQLAGPHVFGPPRDRAAAIAVLHEAMELGLNHIDTSDYYGPYVTNEIIREALHPYKKDLVIVTKIGARRGPNGEWIKAASKQDLTDAVHDNLKRLGLEAMDIVNLRVGMPGTENDSIAEPLQAVMNLKKQGLVKHIGISTVTPAQLKEARDMTDIVCVQNLYNIVVRNDDGMIDELAKAGIAYVPYFPLGGFTPVQSATLDEVARDLGFSAKQVALAWLLHRSPNVLLIPGTSSVAHLRDNVAAASIVLPESAMAKLNKLA